MKHCYKVLVTTVVTVISFCSILVSSCTKSSNNNSTTNVCQNGGTLTNNQCVCPTGYTGLNCEGSTLVYKNNTFTPVYITVNETTQLIPVGGETVFSGLAGTAAVATAYTSVVNNAGKTVGAMVTWSFTDHFPTGGADLVHSLDVGTDYFYLKVANGDYYDSVVALKVNYNTTDETTDSILLPNNGMPTIIGYYKASSKTQILALSSRAGNSWLLTPTIPNTLNATSTVSVP